jgi:hypothetical protein
MSLRKRSQLQFVGLKKSKNICDVLVAFITERFLTFVKTEMGLR